MRRRAIVALLATVLLFAANLVHSAFACSVTGHAAASAAHRHCNDTRSSPPCCRESAAAVANDRADRVASGARAAPPSLAMVGIPIARFGVASLDRVAGIAVSPSRAASVPPHLRHRSLLL